MRIQKETRFIDPYWCENWEEHTPAPEGYLQWQSWAEEKSTTHMQIKCKGCGLYKIWVKLSKPDSESN